MTKLRIDRKTWKTALGVLLLSAVVLGAVVVGTLHTRAFRVWVLGRILQAVQQKTGTRPQIERLDLSFVPFSADFYGITVHGKEAPGAAPLFRSPHLRLSLRVLPLLRGQVQIDRLTVDQPEIVVRSDAGGQTNLPAAGAPQQAPGFHLSVRYAEVRDGRIRYDDLQIPLSAEVYDLEARLAQVPLTGTYRGEMRYEHGRIRAKDSSSLEHSLVVRVSADSSRCKVEEWKMVARHSRLEGEGVVENYAQPVWKGVYRASVAGSDLGFLLKSPGIPSGDMALQGGLQYSATPDGTFLDEVLVDGVFESRVLGLQAENVSVPVRRLKGRFRLAGGQLKITGVAGEVLGGRLSSASNAIDLKHDAGNLGLDVKGASLEEAGRRWKAGERIPRVVSTADLQLGMHWTAGIRNSLVDLKALLTSRGARASAGDIPLDGAVDLVYDMGRDQVTVRDSTLKTGRTELRASGTVGADSVLKVRLATADLHELVVIGLQHGAADFLENAQLVELRGSAAFEGRVTGRVRDPHLEGRLTGSEVHASGLELRSVETDVKAGAGALELDHAVVESSPQGRLQLAARIPLSDWMPNRSAPFSADVRAEKLPVSVLKQAARAAYPVEGLLTGQLHLEGSMSAPKGRGHLELAGATVYREALSAVSVDLEADANRIHLDGRAQAQAGTFKGVVTYEPRERRYQLEVEARDLDLAKLEMARAQDSQLNGVVSTVVSGSGTLDDPQLKGKIESSALQVRGETFRNLAGQVSVAHRSLEFDMTAVVESSPFAAQGTVSLAGNYPAKIKVDTGKINIAPLLRGRWPATGASVGGDIEVHATVNGPLKEPELLEGRLEIPALHITGKNVALANSGAIRIEYGQGTIHIRDAHLEGSGTKISLGGSMPLGKAGSMKIAARGELNLAILEGWVEGARASGQAKIELQIAGTPASPETSGSIQIANVAYFSDSIPLGFESLNGSATIEGKRIRIQEISGAAGGGKLSLRGSLDFGDRPAYALTLNAQSARVRQNGIRAVVDADLNLNGGGDSQSLDGRVQVHKLSFNEGSDLAEIIAGLSSDEVVSEPAEFEKKIRLNVAVQSDEAVGLSSSQVSVAGSANLRVAGTLARPVVLGRVALTRGEVFFLGKRFELQGGTIAFANTARTRPVLNLYVSTAVEQYNIKISLSGPLDRLKTTYTSEPALPSADIINLLAFGQTTTQAASKSSAPASLGAESAVASAVGGQVAGQLQKVTGISQLTIDPLAGNNQNPGAQIAFQQRVTGNLLITFSTDITSAQSQTVQLKYQVKRNVSVSVLRDENGGYGLDVRYQKVF